LPSISSYSIIIIDFEPAFGRGYLMAILVLKKHPATRAAHYLYLIPFLLTLHPLLVNFRAVDMIIYAAGLALVVFLVIYGNRQPLLRSESDGLNLYLHYRHNAEYHPYSQMLGYRRLTANRLSLESSNHSPVILNLTKHDVDQLVIKLEEEQVHAIE